MRNDIRDIMIYMSDKYVTKTYLSDIHISFLIWLTLFTINLTLLIFLHVTGQHKFL